MSETYAARPGTAVLTDVRVMIARSLRLSTRNVDAMITAVMLPVILLLMFVYLFGGAIHTGVAYVNYVVPGALLVCAGFGVGTTAVSVSNDLHTGVVDRFRSMDVRGEAVIAGHVTASVLRNLVSTMLVFAVALPLGFRSSATPFEWLAVIGVFGLFVFALSWLCAALGVVASSPEAATGMTFLISFLPYPSSAFVPIHTLPSWLQGFAAHQPVTCVIDTLRGLLTGGPVAASAVPAVIWSLGITVASIALAGFLYRRKAA
jgi:ABC-2 type transport system permease protein